MKKLLIALFAILILPVVCFADGRVIGWPAAPSTTEATVGTTTTPTVDRGIDLTARSYGYKVNGTPASNGTLKSISAYLMDDDGNSAPFRLSLYSHDSANDMPGSLIANATSNEGAMTVSISLHTLTVPGSISITSGTQYWIVLEQTSGYNNIGSTGYQSAIDDFESSEKGNAGPYDWPSWGGTENGGNSNYEVMAYFTYEY